MTRWEYRWALIDTKRRGVPELGEAFHRYPEVEAVLNEWGTDGWEAVAVADAGGGYPRVLFKRPVLEEPG